MKEDPQFRMDRLLRKRMRKALLNQGKRKSLKTNDLLGCSNSFLKSYLESKFQEGMSWDNYGQFGWHIDHIKPCISFDLTDENEQRKCFHYTNLQPLWWTENLSKKAKIFD